MSLIERLGDFKIKKTDSPTTSANKMFLMAMPIMAAGLTYIAYNTPAGYSHGWTLDDKGRRDKYFVESYFPFKDKSETQILDMPKDGKSHNISYSVLTRKWSWE